MKTKILLLFTVFAGLSQASSFAFAEASKPVTGQKYVVHAQAVVRDFSPDLSEGPKQGIADLQIYLADNVSIKYSPEMVGQTISQVLFRVDSATAQFLFQAAKRAQAEKVPVEIQTIPGDGPGKFFGVSMIVR